MNKTLLWLRDYGIVFLVFILCINGMQTCNQSTRISSNTKQIKYNTVRLDSINNALTNGMYISKEEYTLMLEIQRLQTAKLVLYDWNSVVRTAVRPDDRMNYYYGMIEKAQKELDALRKNKTQNIK